MKIHAAFLSTVLLLPCLNVPANSQEKHASPALAETNWTIQSSGTSAALYSVHAVSRNVAWACGAGGTVFRTTNEGATWSPAGTLATDTHTIAGLDSNIAIVGTSPFSSTAKIWKTTNGGTSWAVKDSFGISTSSLQMIDGTNGNYIADGLNGQYIRKTTNGGETWSGAGTFPAPSAIYAMFWFDAAHAWLGTNLGISLRTADGGSTWQNSPTSFVNEYSLYFTTLDVGLVGSDVGVVNRTTDGGTTWTSGTSLPAAVLFISGIRGTLEFWASAGPTVYYTPSAGDSWTTAPPNGNIGISQVNTISMIRDGDNVFGWAVGNGGGIAHYKRITTDVNDEEEGILDRFSLSQNYPNPFNPTTAIPFSIPARTLGRTSLRVYDVLGREVATLVDEVKAPGRYQVTWDASTFSSGLYYSRLTSGSFTETKTMLLLK